MEMDRIFPRGPGDFSDFSERSCQNRSDNSPPYSARETPRVCHSPADLFPDRTPKKRSNNSPSPALTACLPTRCASAQAVGAGSEKSASRSQYAWLGLHLLPLTRLTLHPIWLSAVGRRLSATQADPDAWPTAESRQPAALPGPETISEGVPWLIVSKIPRIRGFPGIFCT